MVMCRICTDKLTQTHMIHPLVIALKIFCQTFFSPKINISISYLCIPNDYETHENQFLHFLGHLMINDRQQNKMLQQFWPYILWYQYCNNTVETTKSHLNEIFNRWLTLIWIYWLKWVKKKWRKLLFKRIGCLLVWRTILMLQQSAGTGMHELLPVWARGETLYNWS